MKKLEQNDVALALLSSELQEQAIQFENIAVQLQRDVYWGKLQ